MRSVLAKLSLLLPLAALLSDAAPAVPPSELPSEELVFAEIDGSSWDADGVADGVWTWAEGLRLEQRLSCGDAEACSLALAVAGDLEVAPGAGIASSGDLRLEVGGELRLAAGSFLAASDGSMRIAARGAIAIDGLVSASRDRARGPRRPATISIAATGGPGNGIRLGDAATLISEGGALGGNAVRLAGCGIEVRGLVAAVASGPGAAVTLRSCDDLTIDGRDLDPQGADPGGPRRGRVEVRDGGGSPRIGLSAAGRIVLDGAELRVGRGPHSRIDVTAESGSLNWRGGRGLVSRLPARDAAPAGGPASRIRLSACAGFDLAEAVFNPRAELELVEACAPDEEDGRRKRRDRQSVVAGASGGSAAAGRALACTPDVVLANETVSTSEEYIACNSIMAEEFHIVPQGYVTFRAGQVILFKEGFSVTGSARFFAILDPTLNQPPTITSSATPSAPENQTAVIDVESTDPEGDVEGAGLAYAITGGVDAARFSIDADSGVLTFSAAPDFESPQDLAGATAAGDNVYEVQVTVTDSGGLSDVQDLQVEVTDVNEDPVIISSANQTAAENQTAVATLTATDEDLPAQPLSWSETGGADAALLSISAGGVLTFDAAPSFESKADDDSDGVYEIEVQVDDGAGGLATQTVLVEVTDVNENPVITSSANQTVAENQTAVAMLAATDPDLPAQPLSWSETGGADALLLSITADGALTFDAAPNFEMPADANGDGVYEIAVQVDDGAGGMATQTVLVEVTEVNDDPVIEARAAGLPVQIHVEQNNPAMRLYDRLGFERVEEQGVYWLMRWEPA